MPESGSIDKQFAWAFATHGAHLLFVACLPAALLASAKPSRAETGAAGGGILAPAAHGGREQQNADAPRRVVLGLYRTIHRPILAGVPTSPHPALQETVLAVDGPAFAALATDLLREGVGIRFRARGGSMHPAVRDGDLLTVLPATAANCRRGEVLLCLAPGGGVIAHRLLGWRHSPQGRIAVIRGDASCALPDALPADAILGRAVNLSRGPRRWRLDRPWRRGGGLLRGAFQSLRGRWRGRGLTAGRASGSAPAGRRDPG